MIKLFQFIFIILTPLTVQSKLSHQFSGLMSLNTSNSPFALGEDLEFEITGVYQKADKLNLTSRATSTNFLEPLGTIRKGLYHNIDISFTFVLPVESNITSGHLFSLNHSSKILGFIIKPEFYISNYNLNDIFHLSTSGFSVVAFKKIKFLYLGLGGRLEFIESEYEEKFWGLSTLTSSEPSKTDLIYSSALLKIAAIHNRLRFSATYSISSNNQTASASFSVLF